jgi:GNAT superfamily N-acetyltransferase
MATPTFRIRERLVGDIGWAIQRHGELYHDEHGWGGVFETYVAPIYLRFDAVSAAQPERARLWVAELPGDVVDGRPRRVGTAFVVPNEDDPQTAQLRCLFVDKPARGLGVGGALVKQCIAFARQAGYPRMMLWTNDILASARRIYVAEGFQLEREEPHHSFGQELVGQFWTLELTGKGAY